MLWRQSRPISFVAIALVLAVLSTSLTLVAAIFNYATDGLPLAESIHSASFMGMLVTYGLLVVVSIMNRKSQPSRIEIVTQDDSLAISNSNSKTLWIGSSGMEDMSFRELLRTVTRWDLRQIQVISFQSLDVSPSMLQFVQYLPNLRVLNLQEARVPADCWSRLERCPCLEHVLLSGTKERIGPTAPEKAVELKEIVMTLPEIKFHMGRTSLLLRKNFA